MSADTPVISYLTDLEGNTDFFERFVRTSKVLDASVILNGGPTYGVPILAPNQYFVFGGDAIDKGSGDMKFVQFLISFKDANPNNVFIILGNRDLNKMRLSSELHDSRFLCHGGSVTVKDVAPPYWVPVDKQVSYEKFLKTTVLKNEAASDDEVQSADSKFNRLHWMMKDTMGCQTFVALRTAELKARGIANPTNEDILNSYLEMSAPGGLVHQLLRRGLLACAIGNVAFVHGGITSANYGRVPYTDRVVEDPRVWFTALNTWIQSEIAAWAAYPTYDSTLWRGGEGGMDYGVPGGAGGKTIIYTCHVSGGQPIPLDDAVHGYLVGGGIEWVLLGHTPHGDCPTAIRSPGKPVTLVMADTSYSDVKAPDNRGVAANEVLLCSEDGSLKFTHARVHGVISDGRAVDFVVGGSEATLGIGQATKDGWWVKAYIPASETYYLSKGEGFKQVYSEVAKADIASRL